MDEKRIEIVHFDGFEIEVVVDAKTVKLRILNEPGDKHESQNTETI